VGSLTIPPIDAAAPAKTERLTFGLGCFWCPDSQFGAMPEVVRTRVGYAGGTLKDPTYRNLGDHTECLQVDYDPARIGFDAMLDRIWERHNPGGASSRSLQYRSVIFYTDEAQRKAIEASRERVEAKLGKPVKTAILPLEKFYVAEDYHQKYELRCNAVLTKEFLGIYPDPAAFRESTAAARVNGYLAGKGSPERLKAEIDALGLSEDARRELWIYVR
jgi:methionine-S-sulfoxide reductase